MKTSDLFENSNSEQESTLHIFANVAYLAVFGKISSFGYHLHSNWYPKIIFGDSTFDPIINSILLISKAPIFKE